MSDTIPEHITLGRAKWRVQLKKAIDERCVSEPKAAKKLGISTQQLYNIISGKSYCSQKLFRKINELLCVEARYYYWRKRRSDRLTSVTL